jgi:hypothetical protein
MKSTKGGRTELDSVKLSNALEGKKIHYPSILKLDEEDLKEIKEWMVGKEYDVKLKIKMIKSSAGEIYNDSDKDKIHGEFEVIKADCYKE